MKAFIAPLAAIAIAIPSAAFAQAAAATTGVAGGGTATGTAGAAGFGGLSVGTVAAVGVGVAAAAGLWIVCIATCLAPTSACSDVVATVDAPAYLGDWLVAHKAIIQSSSAAAAMAPLYLSALS